jgi:hypothetical protein
MGARAHHRLCSLPFRFFPETKRCGSKRMEKKRGGGSSKNRERERERERERARETERERERERERYDSHFFRRNQIEIIYVITIVQPILFRIRCRLDKLQVKKFYNTKGDSRTNSVSFLGASVVPP